MRTAWLALLLLAPLLSGCLSFLNDDDGPDRLVDPANDVGNPDEIQVTDVMVHNHPSDGGGQDRIIGNGGVELPYVIYEPIAAQAMADGSQPTFPVVVFVHGFGFTKEMWLCPPMGEAGAPAIPDPCPYENLLERFARAGFIAVAYDARGFGQAGGVSTIAGPDELADLDAVIDFTRNNFPHNGKVGITGISYGGGHALMALALNEKVTTAVPHQGWYDLYDSLLPGNVPKLEWDAVLIGEGTIASGANMHPMVYNWATDSVQRTNLAEIESAMDIRSPAGMMERITKPLLICHGIYDSLFPAGEPLWTTTSGFTRAVVYPGGHGTLDANCWDKTEQWFQFFLRGVDTEVDQWPALETVDMSGGRAVSYTDFPATSSRTFYLREPSLTEYAPSNRTFTIQQQLLNNPLQEPGAAYDPTNQPPVDMPYSLRADPTAVFFEGAPVVSSQVILGSPTLEMVVAPGFENTAFQVTAQLILVMDDGSSRIISRGAYAHVPGQTTHEGEVEVNFHYTKADMPPGSMLVLKVGANDSSWFMPFWNGNDPQSSNFSMQFTSQSSLDVPFY